MHFESGAKYDCIGRNSAAIGELNLIFLNTFDIRSYSSIALDDGAWDTETLACIGIKRASIILEITVRRPAKNTRIFLLSVIELTMAP